MQTRSWEGMDAMVTGKKESRCFQCMRGRPLSILCFQSFLDWITLNSGVYSLSTGYVPCGSLKGIIQLLVLVEAAPLLLLKDAYLLLLRFHPPSSICYVDVFPFSSTCPFAHEWYNLECIPSMTVLEESQSLQGAAGSSPTIVGTQQ